VASLRLLVCRIPARGCWASERDDQVADEGERRNARYRLSIPFPPIPSFTLNEQGELTQR